MSAGGGMGGMSPKTFLICIVIAILIIILASGCTKSSNCHNVTVLRTIESIGGCDNTGRCGVKYDNGEYGRERYPVVGESANKDEEVCN